ncbi:SH3 domain-containing protein [bacterium]|nr:SH3 domain-containing protein [bacterium]MBD5401171.1 SH3 domain-containing protein [bacterium]
MKRLIGLIMMIAISLNGYAEWLFVFEGDEGSWYINSEIEDGWNYGEHIIRDLFVYNELRTTSDGIKYKESEFCSLVDKDCERLGTILHKNYDEEGRVVRIYKNDSPKLEYQDPDKTWTGWFMSLVRTALKKGRKQLRQSDVESMISSDETDDTYIENPRGADEYSSISVSDDSYYIAEVIANKLTVRNGPGANYAADGSLSKGREVVVSGSDLLSENFCLMMTLDGKYYGYVAKKYLKVVAELTENVGNVLEEAGTLTDMRNECEIKIRNDVSKEITVQINGKPYHIASGKTITAKGIAPGKVRMIATAAGFKPYYATDTVKGGYIYDWVFYEVRK